MVPIPDVITAKCSRFPPVLKRFHTSTDVQTENAIPHRRWSRAMSSFETVKSDGASPQESETPFMANLSAIRELAGLIPGAQPTAVNGVRFAASIRPRKFVIEGG